MAKHEAKHAAPAASASGEPDGLAAFYKDHRGEVRKPRRYRKWQVITALALTAISVPNIRSMTGEDDTPTPGRADTRPAVAVEGHIEHPPTADPADASLACALKNMQRFPGITESESGREVVRVLIGLTITGGNVDARSESTEIKVVTLQDDKPAGDQRAISVLLEDGSRTVDLPADRNPGATYAIYARAPDSNEQDLCGGFTVAGDPDGQPLFAPDSGLPTAPSS